MKNGKAEFAPRDIANRALAYAVRAVRIFRSLQKSRDGAALVVGRQYLRSATSIGANLSEAKSAETKADFIHKCAIAHKEVRESAYWLELMVATEMLPSQKLQKMRQETSEIAAILTVIIRRAKRTQRQN